jgi:genome maintenance exonuclease 1
MFNHIRHEFPKLIQENTESGRFYVGPEGDHYPSVTTVLSEYNKQGILEWRKKVGDKVADEISKKATTRGTRIHAIIEDYINNNDVNLGSLMPNDKQMFLAMKKELDKIDNVHCLESKMYSTVMKLAGTVDCIAEYDGVLSVIDFKTSRRLKKKNQIENYFMQGTAYSVMFEELTDQMYPIKQVVILIGVDDKDFAQVLKVNPMDYVRMLKEYIDLYRNSQQVV